MRRVVSVLIFFLALLVPIAAMAQYPQETKSEYDEVFVSGGGSGHPRGGPSYGGGFGFGSGGHWLGEFEVSMTHLGTSALGLGHFVGYTDYPISRSRIIDVMGSGVFDLSRKDRYTRFRPFLRAGVGKEFSRINTPPFHCCAFAPPPGTQDTNWNSWIFTLGAGLRIPIGASFGIRPEIRYSPIPEGPLLNLVPVNPDHWVRATVQIYYLHREK
jgi:hypothetical protein